MYLLEQSCQFPDPMSRCFTIWAQFYEMLLGLFIYLFISLHTQQHN